MPAKIKDPKNGVSRAKAARVRHRTAHKRVGKSSKAAYPGVPPMSEAEIAELKKALAAEVLYPDAQDFKWRKPSDEIIQKQLDEFQRISDAFAKLPLKNIDPAKLIRSMRGEL